MGARVLGWQAMTPKQDSTGAATVDADYRWRPVSSATPRGTKLQLINRPDGVAQYGCWQPGAAWTHWAPLPTFFNDKGISHD